MVFRSAILHQESSCLEGKNPLNLFQSCSEPFGKFGFSLWLVVATLGCETCNIESQVNNSGSPPDQLILSMNGADLRNRIENELGIGCMGNESSFGAALEVEVRTASFQNNQLDFDPNPYSEVATSVTFTTSGNLEIPLEVPEEGAYGLIVRITLNDCYRCCHGLTTDGRGGINSNIVGGVLLCDAGRPRVAVEVIFPEELRPEGTLSIDWSDERLVDVRSCFCTTPPCMVEC